MLVDLLDAFHGVRSEVHLCPADMMRHAILDTLRDFCNATRAYRAEVNDTIIATVSDYPVQVPPQCYPIAIELMEIDGAKCLPKATEWLDDTCPGWRTREGDDFRFFTHVLSPTVITFPCVPTVNGTTNGIYYRISLRPADDATDIDDSFSTEWRTAIEDGAKGDLLRMVNKPWSNPPRSSDLLKSYQRERARARIRFNKSFANTPDRWVGPRFA